MSLSPDQFASLEQAKSLKPKTGLEGFHTTETKNTLKKYPKPFVSILQDDPTAHKTISDIIWEDRTREIQSKQPPQNEKNPDNYSEDPTTAQIQRAIYEKLGIDVKTDTNGWLGRLIKWCVDGLIVWNVELIEQIKKRWLWVFLSEVVEQFRTTDWWKKIFAKIGDDIGNIFSRDPYKTGKTGSEYIGMLGWAGIAGWALKKWWRAVAETGAKVAVTASLWETLWAKVAYGTAKTVEWIGKWTVKIGEILQVPYKTSNKVAEAILTPTINLVGKWLKAGVETLGRVPWVQQVATLVKWSVVRVLAGEGARIVGSRDTPSLLKYQIGATGDDVSKIKPFDKWEWKPIIEEMKSTMEEIKPSELKLEKKELGFDITKNPVYKEYSFLEKYADVLWDLKPSDIISDIGTQALIVKPKYLKWVIAKIERPDAVDKVIDEFTHHNEAYNLWRKWRKDGAIPENIYVPKVILPDGVAKWILLIEQVQWQSFHTKSLIENAYKIRKDAQPLTQVEKDIVSGLTDWDAKWYIMSKYNIPADEAFRVIELYSVDHLWPYLHDRMTPTFKTDLTKTLEYLARQVPWISQWDIHPWNFMITNDKKIYIIDWWRAKMTNVTNPTIP